MAVTTAKKPSEPLASRGHDKSDAEIQKLIDAGQIAKDRADLVAASQTPCPTCHYYSRATRNSCPVCGTKLRESKPRTSKAAKPALGPADYKRLSKMANRFRAIFENEESAVEALGLASDLLELCGDNLDEATSWIQDDDDDK